MTCSTTPACLTCNSNHHRTLSGVNCPCDDGYYDDGSNGICRACDYSCKACTDTTSCTACNSLVKRVSNLTASPFCVCDIKFYEETSSLTCKPCLYHCATCSISNRCDTCSTINFRILNTSSTLC